MLVSGVRAVKEINISLPNKNREILLNKKYSLLTDC